MKTPTRHPSRSGPTAPRPPGTKNVLNARKAKPRREVFGEVPGGATAALGGETEPLYRPLRIYAFDPSQGSRPGNVMTAYVPYERLQPGPIGRRIAVVDYDAQNDVFYEPVNLNDPKLLLNGGVEPSDTDPRFHQQMVYAVVSQTLRTFDRALGREVRFRRNERSKNGAGPSPLRIFPHGIEEENAYYARELHALVFGHFASRGEPGGINIPGQPVFTCLSHDVVVHEATHAIVDGMREYFLDPTNEDSLAFHEAFADLVALFQHFTFPEPLREAIERTGGLIHQRHFPRDAHAAGRPRNGYGDAERQNPLVSLAQQFGEARGTHRALREAVGQEPDPRALEQTHEPHERGAILVAAVFDAFFEVYARRTGDLFRIAGVVPGSVAAVSAELAGRLVAEATQLADEFAKLCIRAVEYCPPVDMRFGDFLRAMVTVHLRTDPTDPHRVRDELIRAFSRRGIYPSNVRSMSVEELRWKAPDCELRLPERACQLLWQNDAHPEGKLGGALAAELHEFVAKNAEALRLLPKLKSAVRSFHVSRFVGAEFHTAGEFVVEVTQQRQVPLAAGSDETVEARGGITLVMDVNGYIRYAISKRLTAERQERQLDYAAEFAGNLSACAYGARPMTSALKAGVLALHRGY